MTNNEFFYDCPIIAAYMVKHHGVKLERRYGTGSWPFVGNWFDISNWVGERLYICEESLPLFEPQEGDVITDSCQDIYGKCLKGHVIEYAERHNGKRHYVLNEETKIIQRNGMPFHMPKGLTL